MGGNRIKNKQQTVNKKQFSNTVTECTAHCLVPYIPAITNGSYLLY